MPLEMEQACAGTRCARTEEGSGYRCQGTLEISNDASPAGTWNR